MDVTGVYHFVKMICDFAKGVRKCIECDETPAEQFDERIVDWQAEHRRVVASAFLAAFLGGIVRPLSAPWFVYVFKGISLGEAAERDKPSWWHLIKFVPYLGKLWVIIDCGCLRGTYGPNQFGPDPT